MPNAPKEGETAGTGAVTLDKPEVFINGLRIPEENVEYSGLAPNLIALWQINVRIPQNIPPGNALPVIIQQRGIPSTDPLAGTRLPTISVRQ